MSTTPEPAEVRKARAAIAAAEKKLAAWEAGREKREKAARDLAEYRKEIEASFLPCPHCGERPTINWEDKSKHTWQVGCPPGCHNFIAYTYSAFERAPGSPIPETVLSHFVQYWNRRTPTK